MYFILNIKNKCIYFKYKKIKCNFYDDNIIKLFFEGLHFFC